MDMLKSFNEKFPNETKTLKNGKTFTYRYYKNPSGKATLVLLTGGIGLSDLLYLHFEKFSKEYSVFTFDYPIQFPTVQEQIDALAELLILLNEKVWLVGQSLGGIMAQVFAKHHPELVEGMALSNTCSLPKNMNEDSYKCLNNMLKSQKHLKIILKILPLFLLKKMMKSSILKMGKNTSDKEKAVLETFAEITNSQLCKEYEYHMINILLDLEKHMNMTSEDFKLWDDKVILIISDDDETFNDSCKKELVGIMTNPTVITDLKGGHLALIVNPEEYIEYVDKYISKKM